MAKKQSRKSISVARDTYAAAKAHADARGVSLSSIVDAHLRGLCGLEPSTAGYVAPAPRPTPQTAAARTELDAIAAMRTLDMRAPLVPLTQAQRDKLAADARARLDEAAAARRERAAAANPCRRNNCGDLSLHAAGACAPQRKPWTRRTSIAGDAT